MTTQQRTIISIDNSDSSLYHNLEFIKQQDNSMIYHFSIICQINPLILGWINNSSPLSQTIQGRQDQVLLQPIVNQPVSFYKNKNKNAQSIISPSSEAALKTTNKSIFHNFQKHLKTLLKKVINIRKNEMALLPSGIRAYELWTIFKEQHNSSKQILYVIFGVEKDQNLSSLTAAAKQIPKIGQMLRRFTISQIQEAQKLLRETVTNKILLTTRTREQLKSLCKITRFDEFYIYLKVFMDELREGGISRRITKVRKVRFMDSTNIPEE